MTAVSCSRITWASPFIFARLLDADWVSFLEHAADCSCSHVHRVYRKESFVTLRGRKRARVYSKGEKTLCFNLQKIQCDVCVRSHHGNEIHPSADGNHSNGVTSIMKDTAKLWWIKNACKMFLHFYSSFIQLLFTLWCQIMQTPFFYSGAQRAAASETKSIWQRTQTQPRRKTRCRLSQAKHHYVSSFTLWQGK